MSPQDQDSHQVILRWPHTDANEVIVTGTFDQWSSSVRLSRKPNGFEAPVFIPWKDKIAYKFIVDGRWMTNDNEPTEIDHGFVNNVYTAPSKPPMPEPQVPPSYHHEPEVEPEHVEKVPGHADKEVENGSAHGEPHEGPIPTAAEPVPEKPLTIPDEVKEVVNSAVDAAHVPTALVAQEPQEAERASEEVASDQALKEPVHIALADATGVEEPASSSVPEPESGVTPDVDATGVDGSVPPEKGSSPTAEAGSKVIAEELAPVPESEPAVPATVEPVPEPTKLEAAPAAEFETVQAPEHEAPVAPAREESAAVPQPSTLAPVAEHDSEPGKSTSPAPAAEPTPTAAPEPEPDVKSSETPSSPSPTAPAVNGHTKTASTASTSTAAPTLPRTPSRKPSRKFSFPGWDKSGNSSPTGSSRFSGQQKREKRHSLMGKLKGMFGDKGKERKEKSAKA